MLVEFEEIYEVWFDISFISFPNFFPVNPSLKFVLMFSYTLLHGFLFTGDEIEAVIRRE